MSRRRLVLDEALSVPLSHAVRPWHFQSHTSILPSSSASPDLERCSTEDGRIVPSLPKVDSNLLWPSQKEGLQSVVQTCKKMSQRRHRMSHLEGLKAHIDTNIEPSYTLKSSASHVDAVIYTISAQVIYQLISNFLFSIVCSCLSLRASTRPRSAMQREYIQYSSVYTRNVTPSLLQFRVATRGNPLISYWQL